MSLRVRTLLIAALTLIPIGCGSTDSGLDAGDKGVIHGDVAKDGAMLPDVTVPADLGDTVQTDAAATDGSGDAADAVLDVPAPVLCSGDEVCDDGNTCTQNDFCQDGLCVGEQYDCDDGRTCTDNVCDGYGGCAFPITAGQCLIHNVCYEDGQPSKFSACIVCDPELSQTQFVTAQDGAPCGGQDPCLAQGSCLSGICDGPATGCDDGNPCTDDYCDASQGCMNTANFDICEDGDPCTLGDQCAAGACVTGLLPLDCDDGLPCTDDLCTPDGCANLPSTGGCSDGNFCTDGDVCSGGTCVSGQQFSCNDGNDCTTDWCDPNLGCQYSLVDSPCCVGSVHMCNDGNSCTFDDCNIETGECFYEVNTGDCEDGDPCTTSETCSAEGVCQGVLVDCDDNNPCTADACDPVGGCIHTGTLGTCDDGNACTENDTCKANGVCSGTPMNCDDGNQCSLDICSAQTGCDHQFVIESCNDGSVCTENDHCVQGACLGLPKNCGDGNPCTADTCHPAAGCQNPIVIGPCDDGQDCTDNDHCDGGQCVGVQVELCCEPEFGESAQHVNSLLLGSAGTPGNALDVDGDPTTCSPYTDCSDGLNNSLSGLASIVNPPLQDAMNAGDIHILAEFREFNLTGAPFEVVLWDARAVDSDCDVETELCGFWIHPAGIDEECGAKYGLGNASINDGWVQAGGPGFFFPIQIPLSGSAILDITLHSTTILAEVELVGGVPQSATGVIGGAILKSDLMAAISAVPEDELPGGLTNTGLMSLINLIVLNDIDTDGDGVLDAASIGLKFTAKISNIEGVFEP